jgi:hypothetical protein
VRKHCIEYLCLLCVLWKTESMDKSLTALKQVVKLGLSDADPTCRKAARWLFVVLRSNRGFRATMEKFLTELDSSAQKLVVIELQQPSLELSDLLRSFEGEAPDSPDFAAKVIQKRSSVGAVRSSKADTTTTPFNVDSKDEDASLRPMIGSSRRLTMTLPTRLAGGFDAQASTADAGHSGSFSTGYCVYYVVSYHIAGLLTHTLL